MKYYLETNSAYKIGKIPVNKLSICYTSYLTFFELVSGLKEANFEKRRNVMKKILESGIPIHWLSPDQVMFQSFNVASEYEYITGQVQPLIELVDRITKSSDFLSLQRSIEYNRTDYGFNYFDDKDHAYSSQFINATRAGHKKYKSLLGADSKLFTVGTNTYKLNSTEEMVKFIDAERSLMHSININTFADIILNTLGRETTLTEQQVYDSYNGLCNIYSDGFTDYDIYRISNLDSPARNDFLDLAHLIYLFDNYNSRIVSDDKLFDHVTPEQRVTFENFLAA